MSNQSTHPESRTATLVALGFGIAIIAGMAGLLAGLKTENLVAQESGGSSGVVPVYYPQSGLRTGQPQWHVVYLIHGRGTAFAMTPFPRSAPAMTMAKTPAVINFGTSRTPATRARTDAKSEQLVPPREAR